MVILLVLTCWLIICSLTLALTTYISLASAWPHILYVYCLKCLATYYATPSGLFRSA